MQPRISLRRVRPDDAEQVARWRAEPSARQYQPLAVRPMKELRGLLQARSRESISPRASGEFQWIVETDDGDAGWVTISIVSRGHGAATIGYTITSTLRGRGYATAAVRAVLPLVFSADKLDVYRLEAVATVENVASRRVLERNGFRFGGIARSYLIIDGVRVDHARYTLLRPEWFDANNPPVAGARG